MDDAAQQAECVFLLLGQSWLVFLLIKGSGMIAKLIREPCGGGGGFHAPVGCLCSAAAGIAVLVRPSMFSFGAFVLLLSVYLGGEVMEGSTNAMLYLHLLSLNLAAGAARSIVEGSDGALFDAMAASRGLTILVYFLSGFVKINTGFFDVRRSGSTLMCVSLLRQLPDRLWPDNSRALLHDSDGSRGGGLSCLRILLATSLFGAVFLELALAPLLGLGWRWAVPCALSMHLVMGSSLKLYMWAFSLPIVAAVPALWLPGAPGSAADLLAFAYWGRYWMALCAVAAVASALRSSSSAQIILHMCYSVWSSCLLCWVCYTGALRLEHGLAVLPRLQGDVVSLAGWLTLLATLAAGLAPFLGLRTHLTWSMFSNLRVEAGSGNHLLVRCSPWTDLLNDAVVVHDSDEETVRGFLFPVRFADTAGPRLRHALADLGIEPVCYFHNFPGYAPTVAAREDQVLPYTVPYFQLRSMVSERCVEGRSFFVRYERVRYQGGAECWRSECYFEAINGVPSPGSDDKLARLPPKIARKLAYFRSFSPSGPARCTT